jgi:predicted O-linked N-acetylglucosamine transferase (SPINDLY family)
MLANLWHRLFVERRLMRALAEAQRRIEGGEFGRADSLCVDLLRYAPRDLSADLHLLRGMIAVRERRLEEALRHLNEALAVRGPNADIHLALADAHRERGDATGEAASLDRVLELLPAGSARRLGLMLRRAGALHNGGQWTEAEQWYRRVLEMQPHHPEALLRLAVLREIFNVEEARSYLDQYVLLRGDAAARLRRALMLPSILQSEEEIERVRRRLDRELDEVIEGRWAEVRRPEHEIGSTAFALAYHGRNDRALMRKLGRACRAVYPARAEPTATPRRAGGRLRVGFVSMYFHYHSIARTHSGFVAGLSRDQFEVHVFAIAPRDDEWAQAVRSSAEHYVALPLDLDRARAAIEAAALDVLFYTDIGMDPHTYFLAFWRLAPIQAVSWGHPATTGIDTIDYFVSAEGLEAPDSEDHYTEALVRLPGYFMPRYRRPRIDAPAPVRAQLGVPADTHVYCCLQTLFKLHPQFDLALRGILEGDSRAAIVLLESSPPSWMQQLRQRFERTLGALASRVHFVPRMAPLDYQRFVAAADVVLDPFHFGGANSSCEALSFGVPIVTLPAFQLRGRFTLGLYDELDIQECVAASPEEYIAIALRLGHETEYRADLSARIAERCERLFDRPEAGRALAEALPRLARQVR